VSILILIVALFMGLSCGFQIYELVIRYKRKKTAPTEYIEQNDYQVQEPGDPDLFQNDE
jgi:hypothetical protein